MEFNIALLYACSGVKQNVVTGLLLLLGHVSIVSPSLRIDNRELRPVRGALLRLRHNVREVQQQPRRPLKAAEAPHDDAAGRPAEGLSAEG